MKLKYFALLSTGSLLILSGCYERGKVVPPSPKHIKQKKKEEIIYDFPVLKLSAKADNSEKPEEIIKKKATTNIEQKNESTSLRFPKMLEKPITDINETTIKAPIEIEKTSETQKTNSTIEIKRDALKKVIAQTKRLQEKDQPKVEVKTRAKDKKEVKQKLTLKRRPRKSSESSQIPILSSIITPDISLQDIPILNKIIPKPSEASKGRIRKNTSRQSFKPQNNRNTNIPTLDNSPTPAVFDTSNKRNGSTSFSGGTSARGLDMAKIRIETDNYQTNIVLDSYLWVKYNEIPTTVSAVSGTYFFKYEPYNNRIVGHIKGYNTFSALLTKKDDLLANSPIIKNIYIDRYVGNDGIKFIIELKKKVKVNILDVEDPGSIIVELYPLKSR